MREITANDCDRKGVPSPPPKKKKTHKTQQQKQKQADDLNRH